MENTVEEKEVDFFEEHEKIVLPEITPAQSLNVSKHIYQQQIILFNIVLLMK